MFDCLNMGDAHGMDGYPYEGTGTRPSRMGMMR